jgi:hypothetical protein
MISINRKKKKRRDLNIWESKPWERREKEEEEKRWENKGKRKGVGGNKFKGKIMYKCVFFKP